MRDRSVRNFCIIAHIDHGKSTLADRFIELTKLITKREQQDQILDSLDIERERGITIKSQVVTLDYHGKDKQWYRLNLVDTPGHVDFSYEVSRAIASCEGALLLVDATQGIQAQTLANFYMALDKNLTLIPVINKIDMPAANIDNIKQQIEEDLGIDQKEVLCISAKTGLGVEEVLEAICQRIPKPFKETNKPLRALIFDSHYNEYRGVVIHIRIMEGSILAGQTLYLVHKKKEYKVEEVGFFRLGLHKMDFLTSGEVGYVISNIKNIKDVAVGDTLTTIEHQAELPLQGFQESKPVVFSSIYPVSSDDYEAFVKAMERLALNDASISYEKDSSAALGFGFRCGFLGLLHMEVVQERLEREHDINILFTAPSVNYKVTLTDGKTIAVDNPMYYPNPQKIASVQEPYIKANMLVPAEYVGNIMTLCVQKRGQQLNIFYLNQNRVELVYKMPLSEVLYDFYDKLKSYSKGYASFDYQLQGYEPTELVKLDIFINKEPVDALAQLLYKHSAYAKARVVCKKLKAEIDRQQFAIAIQGVIGTKVIARESIAAFRKDVTAKCYGGDISRKRKLLEKQKKGKKRMKMVGNVELSQKAFLAVLKADDSS